MDHRWVIGDGLLRRAQLGMPPGVHVTSEQTSSSLTKRAAFDGIFYNTTAEFEAEVSPEDRAVLRSIVCIWEENEGVHKGVVSFSLPAKTTSP